VRKKPVDDQLIALVNEKNAKQLILKEKETSVNEKF